MRPRPRIDVSSLETTAFGPRGTLWWGVVSMLAIETTMFALLFATYYYLRGNEAIWPPSGGDLPFGPATACLAFLLLSVPPMVMVYRESGREKSLRTIRFWLIISMALGLIALVLRAAEFAALPFRWDHHAYGSIVWVTIGMHAIHLLTSGGENILFAVLLFKGPVEERHLVDLRLNALYWYVVVVWNVMVYALIYLDPGVLRT
jgi:heme/copper-type cytochrome/quinol oxidase subunit 3